MCCGGGATATKVVIFNFIHAIFHANWPYLCLRLVHLGATASATPFPSFIQSNYPNCNTIWRLIFPWQLMKFHDARLYTHGPHACNVVQYNVLDTFMDEKKKNGSELIFDRFYNDENDRRVNAMFFNINRFAFFVWWCVSFCCDRARQLRNTHIARRSLDIKAM